MGFTQGVKRPIAILYKRLSSPVNIGHVYSTCTIHGGSYFARVSKSYDPVFPSCYHPVNGFTIYFGRHFSSGISASEQTILIKQLRERTSAPIKDVKSALVACNWNIEAAQKDLRKRGVVLASKKSSRTAAEGLLQEIQRQFLLPHLLLKKRSKKWLLPSFMHREPMHKSQVIREYRKTIYRVLIAVLTYTRSPPDWLSVLRNHALRKGHLLFKQVTVRCGGCNKRVWWQ